MSSAAPSTDTPTAKTSAHWVGVGSLGIGVFAIVMSEYLPASLLPPIAADLGISVGAAGQSVTVTAVAAALSALFISVVLPRTDRRRVMLGLTLLAVISDVVVGLAPNLAVVLASRFLLGIALGGFWAMATAMAASLVPEGYLGRALTVINIGVSVATVGAVPLGAWLGDVWGWRAVFLLGAGLAAVALIVQAVTLPHVAAASGSGLRALGSTLRSRVVIILLFAVLLVFSGHFSGFTYIRPISASLSNIDTAGLALLLLVFGIANFLGTAVGGTLADRALRVTVFLFPALAGIGMFVMLTTGGSTVGLYVAAALWGFGFGGVPTAALTWGAKLEPTRLEQIGGLIITVCNIGVAVGAILGGIIVDGVSPSASLVFGGLAALAGAVLLVSLRQHPAASRPEEYASAPDTTERANTA
ncbi:MFS transporter [Curtobacterium sp. ISL-83]|uniref:MFS transporter n=1 Tax=Curtobacterium sp. ISL-83 TaxID=2819145 RepID=UPI001BE9E23E|nr:MFS transporter [Curtobacterium sp. ISL-83]